MGKAATACDFPKVKLKLQGQRAHGRANFELYAFVLREIKLLEAFEI